MEELRIHVDGVLYSADVVTQAAHRQTNRCEVAVYSVPEGYLVVLLPKPGEEAASETRFRSDLLDERLRERVSAQTANLKHVLLAAALREAGVPQT